MITLPMLRFLHRAMAVWFALAVGMTQSCVQPPTTADPYTRSGQSAAIGNGALPAPAPHSGAARTGSGELNEAHHIDTSGYRVNQSESKALTDYLAHHRLPLVGGQVLTGPDAQRAIVLYGYVGTDFGRSDAVSKARRYVGDSSIPVDNRIQVQPELLANSGANTGASSPDADAGSAPNPDVQSYVDQQNQQQQQALSQYQNQGSVMTSAIPLVLMLGILSMGMSGGGVSIGPGAGSPFGPPPYNPYPGYPSPPNIGSPLGGSPYGSSPFGGSPYGSSPFGGSPFGSSPGFP